MLDCAEKRKRLREANNMTQAQVGKRVGVSKATISAYETASKIPSVAVLTRLACLFHVNIDYLVCVDAPKALDVSTLDDETMTLLAAIVKKL